MRWLFHVQDAQATTGGSAGDTTPYAPASLATEGFIHASFLDDVVESARLYFPAGADLRVLQIDPRRLDVPVVVATTPRGPMPHIHGPVPRDAIRAVHTLESFTKAGLTDRASGTRFGFVAFEGMTLLDLVGVYDPLSRLRSMNFDATSTCEIVGVGDPRVWAHAGATLSVERVSPEVDDFDVLVVPGGLGTRSLQHDEAFVAWLSRFPENRLLASVCTGALLLGAAGRLQGKQATTHRSALADLARYGATPVSARVVDEGQVVTAGGVTSALDLGLHLVRRLEGDEVARKIAHQMEWSAA